MASIVASRIRVRMGKGATDVGKLQAEAVPRSHGSIIRYQLPMISCNITRSLFTFEAG